MATSYNLGMPSRAHTYPQYAHTTQFGSVNPVTSYRGGAGPTPFASIPYISPTFTGMPQQPVYNITNVYVPQQQQQQQQDEPSALQNYNGMFTLLDGALKIAGAVLELANDAGTVLALVNGAGTGSGFSF
jgi:hypothetical protein